MEFTLESWKKEYISNVARYANNKNIAKNLRDAFPFPYTPEDAAWYVNDCIAKGENNQLCKAIVVDGDAVGSIGVFRGDDVYKKSLELGYWLGEEYWNSGIMTAAVKRICTEAFNCFDVVRIFAEPFAHNEGSRRVLEKAGFMLEGVKIKSVYKYGQIYDSCIYALVK